MKYRTEKHTWKHILSLNLLHLGLEGITIVIPPYATTTTPFELDSTRQKNAKIYTKKPQFNLKYTTDCNSSTAFAFSKAATTVIGTATGRDDRRARDATPPPPTCYLPLEIFKRRSHEGVFRLFACSNRCSLLYIRALHMLFSRWAFSR